MDWFWSTGPFWFALFVGNIFSVVLLAKLVPVVCGWLGWWLAPRQPGGKVDALGAALWVAIYAVCLAVFWRM